MKYEVFHLDREHYIAAYWFHDDYLYEGVQISQGFTEWPSYSVLRIWSVLP